MFLQRSHRFPVDLPSDVPFTLAHPAAVLPLRRTLWLPGLVAGAVAPDVGYYLPLAHTHGFVGGFLAGVGLLLVGRVLLPSLMALAPAFARERVARPGRVTRLWWRGLSVAVGVGTHLGWDLFTQNGGLVRSWAWLDVSVVGVHRLYNVIGYVSSLGGVLVLVLVALRAPRRHDWPSRSGKSRYQFPALICLAAVAGATWSLSDPVSLASGYDWVRQLLLGVIQGTCVGLAVHAACWHFNQSRIDRR